MGRYIGIDIGTSSVKTMLVDQAGALIAEAERPVEVSRPRAGWGEIDPDRWWTAACGTVREVVGAGGGADVLGIGVTGQMHTTVFVDARGRSIRPALMWNDARTADLVPDIRRRLADAGEGYLSRLVSTGSPAANLAWLAAEEPESFERLATFLIGPDWVVFRLTGSRGTDYCEASTSSLFDLGARRWSGAARDALGLPERIFPTVRGAATVAGTLLPDVARELGLPPTVRVVAGTGDNPAAAIPTGVLTGGSPSVSLGTSGVLLARRDAPDLVARGKNILFSLGGTDMSTLVQGVVQSCGSAMTWLMGEILREGDYAARDREAGTGVVPVAAPMFYPHLMGDKTIYGDPSLTGALLGLTADTTRGDVMRAVMEGVCLAFRQLADEMAIDVSGGVSAIGGGSKSPVWMQLLADVLDAPVTTLEGQASAGFGAALLAMLACGDADRASLGSVGIERRATFVPREDARACVGERYARYLRVHDALGAIDERGR